MGQKLATSAALREKVTRAIEITQHCQAYPAQCDQQALELALTTVGAVVGGGATVLLIKNLPKIAVAARVGLQACLSNMTLCVNRAGIAVAEIAAGDAVGGATIAVSATAATSKGAQALAEVVEDVAAAKAVVKAANTAVDFAKFEVAGLKAERILLGSGDKVAVIGRTMGNDSVAGVRDYANALRKEGVNVEIFDGAMISAAAQREFSQLTAGGRRLSNQELTQTKMFQENKEWAAKLRSDGYTVIDLGNPYPKTSGFSPFYAVEKKTIFSGSR